MALTPAQRETATSLFETALDCQPGARLMFVRDNCYDWDVRQEVERLLTHCAEMGSFLKEAEPADTGLRSDHAIVPTFSEGDTLAGRFRITRFIAHGGMGEVYEAEDLELHEPVAIKTIRSDLLRPPFLDRFKKEVQLARKVTHPNVCRVHDFFRHTNPVPHNERAKDDLFFVSMELLAGETLAEHLRRSGRMTSAEAFPIIEQIAAALEGAHAVGVLHRDLKPENVMLVPSQARGSVRAVVTDFGLALASTASLGADHCETFAGTPVYMSPEQLRGDELSPASDVYSLGLIIYRMLTGVRAFEHEEPTLLGLKRLSTNPQSPCQLVPDLDQRWDTVILKCLEREPGRRIQRPKQAVEALKGETALNPRVGRIVFCGLAVALIVVLILLALKWSPGPQKEMFNPHSRVAVLGFKNASASPDAAWISEALSMFLTAKLPEETVPEDEIARIKTDLSLSDIDSLAKGTLAQIRSEINADLVILGFYRADLGQVRFNVRIVDSATGVTIGSFEEIGSQAALLEVFARTGTRLRALLKLPPGPRQGDDEAIASLPSNLEAFRLYAEGVEKLRRFDALSARDQLERAVRADPRYPLAHSALAEAWSALGYDEKAATAAKRAFDLSGRLSWRDRQLIEGRYREISKQWGLAAEIYRRLWSAYPREIDYGLRLASVQTSTGNLAEALATVKKLRTPETPGRDDSRVDYAEALAQGDAKAKQLAAARAAEKAASTGQRQLFAAARRDEGRILGTMGRRKEAIEALNQAKSIYVSLGDRTHVAYVTLNLATVLDGQASRSSRKPMIEQALREFRSVGCKDGEGVALNNLAGLLEDTGRFDEALETYRQALSVYGEIGDKGKMANILNNIGTVLDAQGDTAGALKKYAGSFAIWKALKNRGGVALSELNMAQVLYMLGRLTAAATRYDDVLAILREVGTERFSGEALRGKGDIFAAEGHLALARAAYEKALAIARKTDGLIVVDLLDKLAILNMHQGDLAEARKRFQEASRMQEHVSQLEGQNDPGATNQLVAARLLLEEGKAPDAEVVARVAVQQLSEHYGRMDEASGRLVLVQSLLAQSKLVESTAELQRVAAFLKASQNHVVRFDYLITKARAMAASGNVAEIAEARRTLQMALDEARAQEFETFQLEARLAEVEIELGSGDPDARDHLVSLKAEATKNGFGLIAQKASRLTLNAKP